MSTFFGGGGYFGVYSLCNIGIFIERGDDFRGVLTYGEIHLCCVLSTVASVLQPFFGSFHRCSSKKNLMSFTGVTGSYASLFLSFCSSTFSCRTHM